jgi:serine/threonine protein phosphatase 1
MIYVISDIHGNIERYRSVMEKINLQPDDTLYILGDVVDRYPGGIQLLQEIMSMKNAKMLLGNHEYMMLCVVGNDQPPSEKRRYPSLMGYIDLWYSNGGKVTHDAFNALAKKDQKKILTYLRSLPVNIDITVGGKRYKLVHGSSLTKYPSYVHGPYRSSEYVDKTEFAVWERWEPTNNQPRSYTMIFGHTPTCYYQGDDPIRIYKNKKVIGIDCGSGYSRMRLAGARLACLRLDDMKEFYSDCD